MATPRLQTFILKVASRCNLNCSYCYVYNKSDSSWRSKPAIMSRAVLDAALSRIVNHLRHISAKQARVTLHGGEPTLLGAGALDYYLGAIREALGGQTALSLGLQTNATLVTNDIARVLRRHDVQVGVSLDGPFDKYNTDRLDHRGASSFTKTIAGVNALLAAGNEPGALCVIPLEADPAEIHQGLLNIGFRHIDYLIPDCTPGEQQSLVRKTGPLPLATFLIGLFDDWITRGAPRQQIPILEQMVSLVMGGRSTRDTFGGSSLPYVFIETDGEIEGLDVLRVCGHGLTKTSLNVVSSAFSEFCEHASISGMAFRGEFPLPTECTRCDEAATCAGGYLPHRYRPERLLPLVRSRSSQGIIEAFNHPSLWCDDLLHAFSHIRASLSVSSAETLIRRATLHQLGTSKPH
jgi:uncharacterized protein